MSITINEQRRFFVIPCGNDGYTTAGFDYVLKQLRTLEQRLAPHGLDIGPLDPAAIGTLAQYEQYTRAWQMARGIDLGTWFDADTPDKVRHILERYRKSGDRLRLFYGDVKTGQDWMEENDVMGRIGRSTGPQKIPLLIADGEHGGGGILDGSIVRIIDVKTRAELYRHPSYTRRALVIKEAAAASPSRGKKYTHDVVREGSTMAYFTSYGKAAAYLAFMCGDSMEQPRC